MLVAAALCPHPPILVPALSSGASSEVDDLRQSCVQAVSELDAVDADELIVIGIGPTPGTAGPTDTGSFAGFGADVNVALSSAGGPGGAANLPLSVTMGVWLLREAGITRSVRARVVTENATTAECLGLGERIAAFPGRTALLVMGDSSARRTEQSPGYVDTRAIAFDDAVTAALASADVSTMAGLDPALARELWVAGRAPWQILAGAAGTGQWHAELLYSGAPYGVGYVVATWTR